MNGNVFCQKCDLGYYGEGSNCIKCDISCLKSKGCFGPSKR